MKKLLFMCIFVIAVISIFASCKETSSKDEGNSLNNSFLNDNEVTIINIVDATLNAALDDVEEVFYEDETHKYIFSNQISENITVFYSDGSSENIKVALNSGRALISDLDKYNIKYFAEPKLIEIIVYHDDRGGEDEALETFYSDDKYNYIFPTIRSDVVIVYFKDGNEKNVVDALNDGSARISDLDWFGIDYYKNSR